MLSTGRCGSTTFARACGHIENYSAAHESRISRVHGRIDYPDDHIEVDNHLAWFLGRLDERYGDDAFYVHLKRDLEETAQSRMRREARKVDPGLMWAYGQRLVWENDDAELIEVCRHYCHTVNSNIQLFLKDKNKTMTVCLESARENFRTFWDRIGATGNLESAVQEWERRYNRTEPVEVQQSLPVRAVRKVGRLMYKLPEFIKDA
ncbi:putative TIM-barrel fold metal-dependent hydrolase [Salinibacter ruber]|nr:putative TIM-barrel fold metal-dependent hydrolase [Salinibacter ruber]